MPTFDRIGLFAPLLVIVARLVQGFSAGGEFGSSTAFLVEHMPGRRGFVASWQFASQGLSSLLGAGFGALLTSTMSEADLQSWGWRIPFLFGALIGPIGLYIRNRIDDATAPPAGKHDTPVRNVFMTQKFRVLLGVGTIATATSVNYLIIYMPTYVVKALHLSPTIGYLAAFAAGIAGIAFNPVAGWISDRVGRTTYLIIMGTVLLVAIFPLFLLLASKPGGVVIVLGSFALIGDLAPGYYLTAVCLFSLWSLITIHRTSADKTFIGPD
jgi:MHS family proline/betaine transporter-like MFS transporter